MYLWVSKVGTPRQRSCGGRTLPSRKLLLVDDQSQNLFILEEILEDYELRTAASGTEALALMEDFRPDLVLLDVTMPGMDGYEVCRRIRTDETNRFTKVVFLSARVGPEDRLAGYEAGGDDYLTKPFDSVDLLAKVDVLLSLKHVQEDNLPSPQSRQLTVDDDR